MGITKTVNGPKVTLLLSGRLDTITSVEVDKEIDAILSEGPHHLTLDLKGVDYISSAGVRVLLEAQRKAKVKEAEVETINVSDNVFKVLTITGVAAMLNVKTDS